MKVFFDGDEHDEENSAECGRVTEQAKLDWVIRGDLQKEVIFR